VQSVHWSSHTSNKVLHGKLPLLSDASRRLQLAGHCFRHPELSTQRLVQWEPKHGQRRRGRPKASFVDTLRRDTGLHDTNELAALMAERTIGEEEWLIGYLQ